MAVLGSTLLTTVPAAPPGSLGQLEVGAIGFQVGAIVVFAVLLMAYYGLTRLRLRRWPRIRESLRIRQALETSGDSTADGQRVSAATSTILVTLKPAETAELNKRTAEALERLGDEIDLFESAPPTPDAATSDRRRQAAAEAQHRLAAARNRPRPVHLDIAAAAAEPDGTSGDEKGPGTSAAGPDHRPRPSRLTVSPPSRRRTHYRGAGRARENQPIESRRLRRPVIGTSLSGGVAGPVSGTWYSRPVACVAVWSS